MSKAGPDVDGGEAAPEAQDLRHRRIRSFVTRAGRTSPAQQRARDVLGARFVVPFAPGPVDFAALFGRAAPVVLEIGFGMGAATAEAADARREASTSSASRSIRRASARC